LGVATLPTELPLPQSGSSMADMLPCYLLHKQNHFANFCQDPSLMQARGSRLSVPNRVVATVQV
jgi:hypothetical protein